jgi:hypothetical protein
MNAGADKRRARRGDRARLFGGSNDDANACEVLTIGHSTRPIDEFVTLRGARRDPTGRRPHRLDNPQFNADARRLRSRLPASATCAGPRRLSPTSADAERLAQLSFRNMPHMQSPDFVDNLVGLIELTRSTASS